MILKSNCTKIINKKIKCKWNIEEGKYSYFYGKYIKLFIENGYRFSYMCGNEVFFFEYCGKRKVNKKFQYIDYICFC